ncbi:MAG: CRISPR-associated protein Cas4 [Rhodobacteraceae bacterium]|nr:CRISPR-associated protein Cas4 [Paracoccaceae bacterium]MCW9043635.1 CRISPR-associated protein Cas4 [Pseudopelagicola sp.]
MSNPSEDIALSALQHWLYCPRQYALIHLERLWAENRYTAEGRILHEKVDAGQAESRPGLRILRAVELRSDRLGLHGVADVVELRGGVPYPVEYKRGRPKAHRADEVQLCAQALCLEEMFGCDIGEGALFYGQTRRRKIVRFDVALRSLTQEVTNAVRTCREGGKLPPARYEAKRCDACSLIDHCRPRVSGDGRDVQGWLLRAVEKGDTPE